MVVFDEDDALEELLDFCSFSLSFRALHTTKNAIKIIKKSNIFSPNENSYQKIGKY